MGFAFALHTCLPRKDDGHSTAKSLNPLYPSGPELSPLPISQQRSNPICPWAGQCQWAGDRLGSDGTPVTDLAQEIPGRTGQGQDEAVSGYWALLTVGKRG